MQITKVVLFAVWFCTALPGQTAEEYLQAARDKDPEVRRGAVANLRTFAPSAKILSALIATTHDSSPSVRSQAANSLATWGPKIQAGRDAVLALLHDPDARVRIDATWALTYYGSSAVSALPFLRDSLLDSSIEIRIAALSALATLGKSAAPAHDAVVQALQDSSPAIRAKALLVIASLGTSAPNDDALIFEALSDPEDSVRVVAISAIGSMGERGLQALPTLDAILRGPSLQSQTAILHTLYLLGAKQVTSLLPAVASIVVNPESNFIDRANAADLLANMGEPGKDAYKELVEALSANHEVVRNATHYALARLYPEMTSDQIQALRSSALVEPQEKQSKEAEKWISNLNENWKVRQEAVTQLGKIGIGAAPALTRFAIDRKNTEEARIAALQLLRQIGYRTPQSIPVLVNLANGNDSVNIQASAIAALGEMKSNTKASVDALIEATKRPAVRTDAIYALGNIGPDGLIAASLIANTLKEAQTSDPVNRRLILSCLYGLGGIGPNAQKEIGVLTPFLQNSDREIRYEAITALGKMRAPEAVPALLTALRKETIDWNRKQGIFTLEQIFELNGGRVHAKEAVPYLLQCLKDQSQEVRSESAGALGWAGQLDALPALIEACQDNNAYMRFEAAASIGILARLNDPAVVAKQALATLVKLLKDQDASVRQFSAHSLAAFGEYGAPALPALKLAMADDSAQVQKAITEAINKITQD